MSTFSGPMRDRDGNVRSPRDRRDRKETKRLEAEVRAETVEHDKTRSHRLGLCDHD